MDYDAMEKKLNQLKYVLDNDNSVKNIAKNIKNNDYADIKTKEEAKQEYYTQLPKYERLYQIENDKYKQLISQFSEAYLEICDFYVGPELPRKHYLQSKKEVQELYLMLAFYAVAEPYINAYHDKFG